MQVKILVALAGERFAWAPGDVVSLVDDKGKSDVEEANRLIAAGYAVAEPAGGKAVKGSGETRA